MHFELGPVIHILSEFFLISDEGACFFSIFDSLSNGSLGHNSGPL